MFILSNFLSAVAWVLNTVLTILYWLVLIRALLSWVNPDPSNPIVMALTRITEPILSPIRRFLPAMAIDISPIIAFLVILFLQKFLVSTLYDLSYSLR